MKKAFISVAFAAALIFGASAQTTTATVPNWFTYQGVTEQKNVEVPVVFYVLDANNEPVYAEKHMVTTNAAGAFTCQLGLGEPEPVDGTVLTEEFDVKWAEGTYSVQTWINGKVVGTAQLGSVPYAKVAEKALEIVGVEGNLAEMLELLKTDTDNNTQMGTWLNNNLLDLTDEVDTNSKAIEALEQSVNVELPGQLMEMGTDINKLREDVDINIEGLANAEQNIIDLTEQVKSNTAAIALLNGGEEVDLSAVNARIDALEAEVEINSNGLAEAEKSISEISEEMPGITSQLNKLREDVDINIEGLANAEQALIDLSPAVAGNTAAIAKLQEDVEINSNGLAEAEQAISEISEQMPGITGKINALTEQMEGIYEAFETQAMAAITSLSNRVEDMDADLEALKADVAINIEGLANAEQTLIELTEQVKSNTAGVAALEGTWDEILKLKALIQTQGEAIADLQQQLLHK